MRSGRADLQVLALELLALEPSEVVLNPEAMALLGDQPRVDSGTWKTARKARQKASRWPGERALSCSWSCGGWWRDQAGNQGWWLAAGARA